MNHVKDSLEKIRAVLKQYRQPAVLSSFGKDSMVLLHLVHNAGEKLPVICHETPFMRHKWAFGQIVAAQYGLTLHDAPPHSVVLQRSDDGVELVWQYEIGPGKLMGFQRQAIEPVSGKDWVCGLRDVLGTPTASAPCRWDALLSGQRSADVNRKYGKMPLAVDALNHGGLAADVVFILREWSDDQVWDYIAENKIAVNTERYERQGKRWLEKEDKWHSNDWVHACTRCIDCKGPDVVKCPLTGMEINNVSAAAPYIDFQPPYFEETKL